MNETPQITEMLHEWSNGSHEALEKLIPLVYDELHNQAAAYLRRERQNHTLQTTALIHETYIKLINQKDVNWESRTHFFAIAAQLMRRILVDHARAKNSVKRGGEALTMPLEEAITLVIDKEISIDLVELDEALNRLAERDKRQVQIVELRYFSGLTLEETATALNVSRTTVVNNWSMAKAWLHRELKK